MRYSCIFVGEKYGDKFIAAVNTFKENTKNHIVIRNILEYLEAFASEQFLKENMFITANKAPDFLCMRDINIRNGIDVPSKIIITLKEWFIEEILEFILLKESK